MIEINHVTRYSVGAKGNSRGISKVPDGNDPKTSYEYLYLSHAFSYCFTSNGMSQRDLKSSRHSLYSGTFRRKE